MVRDTYTTTRSRTDLIRMFLDGTAGEVYAKGRLATVERENDIALVGYGEHILATIDGYDITFYTGHYNEQSETVTEYIRLIGSLLNETSERTVTVHGTETPQMGIGSRASDAAQYINNYVGRLGSERSLSDVEKDAITEVNNALLHRMGEIFG